MKLLLLYLFGLSSFIHHCLIVVALAIVYVCYKLTSGSYMRSMEQVNNINNNTKATNLRRRSMILERFKNQVERATNKMLSSTPSSRSSHRRVDFALDAALASAVALLLLFGSAMQVECLEQVSSDT